MMKYFHKIFAVLTAIVFVIVTIPMPVSAVSAYDNAVQIAYQGDMSFGPDNIAYSWYSKVKSLCTGSFTDLDNAINNGGEWAVVKDTTVSSGSNRYIIHAWDSAAAGYRANTFWNVSGSLSWVSVDHSSVWIIQDNGSSPDTCFNSVSSASVGESKTITSSSGSRKLFLSTYDNSYPTGYAGTSLVATPDLHLKDHPEIDYNVLNKNLTAKYKGNLTCITKLQWTITKTDGTAVFQTPYQDASTPLVYDFENYGDYLLTIDHVVPPYIDSCVNVLSTAFTLHIDGTNFSGSSTDMTCGEYSGYASCIPKPVYEDCNTYGTDVVGGIGCQFRNFGTYLKSLLIGMFVPNSNAINEQMRTLREFFSAKLGFLGYPLIWIADFISAFSAHSGDTKSCNIEFDGTLFGGHPSMNYCSFENIAPSVFDFARVALQAVTVAGLIFAFYRKYMEVIKR